MITVNNKEIKIGSVFVCQWGYEQTNVDFYQVVSIQGKKTIKLKEIKGIEEFNNHTLQGKIKPDLNNFTNNEEITKRIVASGSDILIRIESFCNGYLVDDTNKGYNFSNYA